MCPRLITPRRSPRAGPALRSPHSRPRSTASGAASAQRCSRTGCAGDSSFGAPLWGRPLQEQPLEHHPNHALVLADLDPDLHGLAFGISAASSGKAKNIGGSARALTSSGMFSKRSRGGLQRVPTAMALGLRPRGAMLTPCVAGSISPPMSARSSWSFRPRRTGPPRTSRPVGTCRRPTPPRGRAAPTPCRAQRHRRNRLGNCQAERSHDRGTQRNI